MGQKEKEKQEKERERRQGWGGRWNNGNLERGLKRDRIEASRN